MQGVINCVKVQTKYGNERMNNKLFLGAHDNFDTAWKENVGTENKNIRIGKCRCNLNGVPQNVESIHSNKQRVTLEKKSKR